MLQCTPGSRLRSVASTAEFVVVRAPADAIDLRCGGHPLVLRDTQADDHTVLEGFGGELVMGKRYSTADGSVEVMVTKAGEGALTLGDEVLERKDAKPLPSSD